MASRYRSLSKPTLSLLKSTITKTKLSNPTPLLCTPGASPTLPRQTLNPTSRTHFCFSYQQHFLIVGIWISSWFLKWVSIFFFFDLTRFSTFEIRSWGLRFLQSTAFSTTEVWILSHFLKLVWVSLISSNYNSWILNFRSFSQIRCLQSLLPLHTAVSSARLTSCLGIDSSSSRSLSQGMICSANPGVW